MDADGIGGNHLSARSSASSAAWPLVGGPGANLPLTVIVYNIYTLTMTQITEPDPDYIRSREAHQHLNYTLSTTLPPPPDNTPETLHQRNQSAIAQVAALCPANAAEATLAAQYVALCAQAMACLRLANLRATGLEMGLKCNAQATSLSRQSHSAMRTLLRMQAVRKKRDADPVTADAAAWTEHVVASSMTNALTSTKPELAPPPKPEPAPPQPEPQQEPDDPEVALYEAIYPDRAALIRRHGGVPADVSFGPPDEATVRALLATRSPTLKPLDRQAA
jgi:hypothetical protein